MNYAFFVPSYVNRIEHVRKLLKPAQRIINFGCGRGEVNFYLREKGKEMTGIDINPADIRTAKRLSKQEKNLRYEVMDATKTKFRGSSFDAAVCMETVEHVKSPEALIREIQRVLKKGGQLVLTAPNRNFSFFLDPLNYVLQKFNRYLPFGWYSYGHNWLPTESYLKKILQKNGFRIQKVEYASSHFLSLLEMYWPGIAQKFSKENASNTEKIRKTSVKFDYAIPKKAYALSKVLIRIDRFLFRNSKKGMNLIIEAYKH